MVVQSHLQGNGIGLHENPVQSSQVKLKVNLCLNSMVSNILWHKGPSTLAQSINSSVVRVHGVSRARPGQIVFYSALQYETNFKLPPSSRLRSNFPPCLTDVCGPFSVAYFNLMPTSSTARQRYIVTLSHSGTPKLRCSTILFKIRWIS